ncbi:MAG: restriction endonuclease, partial [Dehalococcoidia bacterium]|nr:restriction endonuclease [Dehalococcoidia bacterium]
MAMKSAWQEKIEQYCEAFNVPLIHIAEILNEPKVIPMIRGKGFEYTVLSTLQEVLPNNEWKVHKISMSEEAAFHDTDVRVFHKRSGKSVRVEC